MDFNSPDLEYGGGRPTRYKSFDGSYFYGVMAKKGGVLRLVVFHTDADGKVLGTWEPGISGQGGLILQGDTTLEAVGYANFGDGSVIRALPVPGYVPWPGPIARIKAALGALLSPEAFADWARRVGW